MNYRIIIFAVSNLVAVVTLALAYGLDNWGGAAIALGLGLLNWYGLKNLKRTWSADLFLAGTVLLVTIGGLLELNTYLLFWAVVGALAAWDLVRFQKRIEHSPLSDGIPQIEKRHLFLLGLTILIGGGLAGVMTVVRLEISFGPALALGIALIFTLGQIIRLVRR